ncbi:TetR/AcrR family transcriptional regulator [Streptomyces sp. NPDC006510]|uniref:TetR/AcrR family transcriptional regulator n=1 Tax=Streptomyces sp. NPDC006510 TaxID=3155600 RepID=UPI0033BEBAA6
MSPRGVTTPDVRELLFNAAERVLEREGPGALTSRAITGEAGCAKGLLHAHFSGLDEFVAELVLDRFARVARHAEELRGRVGRGTVAKNLLGIALALLSSAGPTVAGLALARPAASLRIRAALEGGAPGFDTVQDAITDYLDAERQGGRIAARADTASAALALVGTLHHLLMTGGHDRRNAQERAGQLVALLEAALRRGPDDFTGEPARGTATDTV